MTVSKQISVALVEDDAPYRAYVAALFESTRDRRVAFAVGSAEEGLAKIAETPVDVLLLDVRLPGMPGPGAVGRFLALKPQLRVIMLTAMDADDLVLEAIRAGACGYLLKGASSEDVLGAVADVARTYSK